MRRIKHLKNVVFIIDDKSKYMVKVVKRLGVLGPGIAELTKREYNSLVNLVRSFNGG